MVTLDSLDLQKTTPQQIGELLIEAKKAYYTGANPIMDDHTYDTLEDILRKKLPYHRVFTKVGHPNFDTGFDKKPHSMFMGSQNKVSSYDDLVHYFELKKVNISEFVIQPKCDGISLEIEYKNGQLIDAITRGDGLIGDVITQNVVKMKNIILNPKNFSGSVRCEIVVTQQDFKKLPETYSNPRNAASGLSQRLDSLYSEYCSLYAVDITLDISESDKIKKLQSLGFTTVESTICHNLKDIENIYQQYLKNRSTHPYEIDGLVIKINDYQLALNLGSKNNRPKFQVAYKFPASSDTTQIKKVTWQVGPLGNITPVAQVEPIELSGAVITFASLANYDLIKKMDLNIGDIVKISRRGDVIPHIEKVITKVTTGHLIAPTHCPDCGTLLTIEDKFLKCPNSQNCLSQILGGLQLFCNTLEILGLSNKTITKLYSANKISLPGDFYKLTVNDIAPLDNLGERSAKNIINQIQSKRMLSVVEVFDAAIIPNFSKKRIQQLIDVGIDTPEKLLNLNSSDLLKIKGFQTTLTNKIINGINLRKSWIESILSQINLKNIIKKNIFNNLIFVITGTLSQPRKVLEDQIITLGGKVLSTVTSNTSYLICNQKSISDKYQKALKLHIPIITEEQYNKLANTIY